MENNIQVSATWSATENGYEKTGSRVIVERLLLGIMQKRRSITLLLKGYQSGPTVFVSIDPHTITIGKPRDWPGAKRVRVVFKDEAKVWNQFTVSVLEEAKDTLKIEFPTELFRLQRRAHFRIEVPFGSRISFMLNYRSFEDVALRNISIGGLMMCFAKGEKTERLNEQAIITHIKVIVPSQVADKNAVPKEAEVLQIAKGVCVRSFEDKNRQNHCLGVKFEPDPGEEAKLMQYIRQLELEELRKGVL